MSPVLSGDGEEGPMDERAFYFESTATRPIELNCPHCRTTETYELRWVVRRKKARLPAGADERDRARFAKAQSYMVLVDDKVACKNLRCRKRFDVSGIKTMAFLSAEQEAALGPLPAQQERNARKPNKRPPRGNDRRQGGNNARRRQPAAGRAKRRPRIGVYQRHEEDRWN